ncbi:hypothetical protein B0H16DRAFT_1482472 [Mycena metata]|uniref:Uncharacterized protein n=1 Tax=Mycena metata TaxID=1033252 RepID=A0AAD7GT20_9AGAR|nr:hypothetical protein B0H16DRAFT_1482472 [Mycena metata]
MSDEHYWSDSESPPVYTEYVHTTPSHTECFGLARSGNCTRPPAAGGFCAAHQGQAMLADPKARFITAEMRRAHTEERRCCGLTKKYQLCNTSLNAISIMAIQLVNTPRFLSVTVGTLGPTVI